MLRLGGLILDSRQAVRQSTLPLVSPNSIMLCHVGSCHVQFLAGTHVLNQQN